MTAGLVVDERAMRASRPRGDAASFGTARGQLFRGVRVLPESPLPPRSAAAGNEPRHEARRLAIQIKPHHNGEILLSVTAAMQNPSFFDWPFTGRTTPKKRGNPSYPQRVVDYEITVHRPDSPDHGIWLARCNQRMPGGGRAARRFGWF